MNAIATTDRPPATLRRCALALLAVGVGSAGLLLTFDDTLSLVSCGITVRKLEVRALLLLFGPAVAGAGLGLAAALLLARRRFALGVYWSAVFLAVALDLMSRFGCLNVSTPPGGASQVVFTSPEYDESVLWHMGQVSVIGLLIVAGYWLSASREGEVGGVGPEAR